MLNIYSFSKHSANDTSIVQRKLSAFHSESSHQLYSSARRFRRPLRPHSQNIRLASVLGCYIVRMDLDKRWEPVGIPVMYSGTRSNYTKVALSPI